MDYLTSENFLANVIDIEVDDLELENFVIQRSIPIAEEAWFATQVSVSIEAFNCSMQLDRSHASKAWHDDL